MEITNFGQALQLALKVEDAAIEAYDQAAQNANDEALKSLFAEFYESNQKRRKTIQAMYDENVDSDMYSGILAPIKPMDGSKYLAESATPEDLEQMAEVFYKDFLTRLDASPRSVVRRIRKMSEENAMRQVKLKDQPAS